MFNRTFNKKGAKELLHFIIGLIGIVLVFCLIIAICTFGFYYLGKLLILIFNLPEYHTLITWLEGIFVIIAISILVVIGRFIYDGFDWLFPKK